MSELKQLKKSLRRTIAERKKAVTMEQRKVLSDRLLATLEEDSRFAAARTVLLYHSLPDEVQTHDFVEKWGKRKEILLPEVVGDDLLLRRYTGTEELRLGAFGIAEPVGEVFSRYEEIDLAIVPGVSFDRQGNRLGRGKGYYDRLLPQLSAAYKMGICFSFQVSEALPTEEFDRPMDAVLTDEGWLR